jgi:hypothetical protein
MLKALKALILITLSSAMVVSTGCDKSGCTDPDALNHDPGASVNCCCEYKAVGTIQFKVVEKIAAEDLQLNQTYQLNGVPMEFTHTGMYFSNFTLLTDTGVVSLPDSYVLYNALDKQFSVHDAPAGSYSGLRFYLGIDSVTNYTTLPADYQPSKPLSSQVPIMHWSWNTGYIFLRFDGTVDTTQPADNTLDEGMAFHIGTHEFLTPIEMGQTFSIADSGTTELTMQIDYEKFFDGIDLSQEYVTHTGDFKDLADKFGTNMAKPFSLK